MNTSQFMDKQIMDLSNSQNKNTADTDFMDLNIHPPQEDHDDDVGDGGDKKDEILPNYDFQPIRPIVSSHLSNFDSDNVGGTRVWASAEFEPNYGLRNYGSLDSVVPSKVVAEKDRTLLDAALISEIDRTMKKHTDNLMHALEGVSARLSQLETRSRNLENSVDDLRTSVGNNHGNTDGKLRQIENMIREVQAGVQVVKDKQEILETQLQLSKIQISKPEQQLEPQIVGHMDTLQQQAAMASAPLQSHQQLPPAALPQSPLATLSNAPPPPNPQPNQFPQNIMPMPISHRDSYYPPPGQTPEAPPPQQYQLPPPQQLQPPMASPPSPRPQYQPLTQIQYSQPPPMSLQQPNPSQSQPPSSHLSEELAYLTSQNYPPTARQPGGGPPQQFHGNPTQMYEPPPPPPSRTSPGFPSQYGQSPGFGEPYSYGGSQYGSGSPVKSQQHSSPNMGPGGGSGYPQLPTARILPQAIPTATAVGGGGAGSSSGSGNRVPIDDVVDKVTNMGFPRDQVRATVRKLTENGQAVDLNVVLDKLMTDGVESANPRPWFGR
ncbi:hypothetical protein L1987_17854 [Smallanthus sonchifolius]|uniref:Uncharacterized protein n=1 Tax=Smallanthus sonchifolius TaxID=185202 RepID=A0ACB9J097_9ASTR|nr:hypothetical protein L1987_17854 [Smallanthus sonchifolius]